MIIETKNQSPSPSNMMDLLMQKYLKKLLLSLLLLSLTPALASAQSARDLLIDAAVASRKGDQVKALKELRLSWGAKPNGAGVPKNGQ